MFLTKEPDYLPCLFCFPPPLPHKACCIVSERVMETRGKRDNEVSGGDNDLKRNTRVTRHRYSSKVSGSLQLLNFSHLSLFLFPCPPSIPVSPSPIFNVPCPTRLPPGELLGPRAHEQGTVFVCFVQNHIIKALSFPAWPSKGGKRNERKNKPTPSESAFVFLPHLSNPRVTH